MSNASKVGPVFELERWYVTEIESAVPLLRTVQGQHMEALRPIGYWVHERMDDGTPQERSVSRIVHQAINDYLDTFADCVAGRGRQATRGTRAMFEHAVNLAFVLANPSEAERYVDHAVVGRMLEIEADPPDERRFTGKGRKAYRHHIRKYQNDTQSEYSAAIAKYGQQFKSAWSTRNLRDRAQSVGLGDGYDSYRLLSAVTHGTGGGDFWQRLERRDGQAVLRTGAALQACPLALRLTLAWFGSVLDSIEAMTSADVVAPMRSLVETLVEVLPEHEDVCAWIDHLQWPEGSVRSEVFVAIDDLGTASWWLRDVEHRKVIRCRVPDLPRAQAAALEEAREEALHRLSLDVPRVLIHVMEGFSTPIPGATWKVESIAFPEAVTSPIVFRPTKRS